jgi:4-hydroxyphenylacetate 3-monooxygenase
MLKTGRDYLQGLRDGRIVYVGNERVDDVTTHPAFRNAARSYARIYDARFEETWRDTLSFEENGERYAMYFLRPRSQDDLRRRSRCNEIIADLTFGLMGRSPDFVGGYITGAAMQPEAFDAGGRSFSPNVLGVYEWCRKNDIFLSHAVAPPQGTRDQKIAQRETARVPSLSVVAEDEDGVTISGMKMLATSAAFSDSIWIGNLLPLAPGHEAESITCIVPPGAPGVSLWSRKPFERYVTSEFDNYLSHHFDEGDCVVICDNVKVPWEMVLTHNDIALSRQVYFTTPAHTLSNHQAAVRYVAKLKLLLGLARRITQTMGIDGVPAVADDLGHLSAQYGVMKGLVAGQIEGFESLPNGYVNYNRHSMYSAIYYATQHYDQICSKVRELSGGSVLQMPADVSVLHDPHTKAIFEEYWDTPTKTATEKFQLFKLAWDLLGSEFGGRHLQYERFYMGPAFIVRSHVSRETGWKQIEAYVDELLSRYGPGELLNRGIDTGSAQGTSLREASVSKV